MEKSQIYQELPLSAIVPSQFNPRKNFEGPKFDGLVASVAAQGVLEPILVRQQDGGKLFEIVAGERRYRAACCLADTNGGRDENTIPAMIRELNDDEAFEIMAIENLHREDLTPFEEAEGFKLYLDRRGIDHLQDLAERTGFKAGYIRKHVAVFELPEKAIYYWKEGKLRFGHLEQLLRVKDDDRLMAEIMGYVDDQLQYGHDDFTVQDLREEINSSSIKLDTVLLDMQAAGCLSCGKNSEVQKSLFDVGSEKHYCNDPACYREKLKAWLAEHWLETSQYKKHKTTRGLICDDPDTPDHNKRHCFYKGENKPGKACRSCQDFVSILSREGSDYNGQVCIGPLSCFDKTCVDKDFAASAGGSYDGEDIGDGSELGPAPRVAWHGEYFREQFFKDELPKRLAGLEDPLKRMFLLVVALVKSNSGLHKLYADRLEAGEKPDTDCDDDEYGFCGYLDNKDIFSVIKQAHAGKKKAIEGIKIETLQGLLHDATIQVIMQQDKGADLRRMVAEYIGIDLQTEWRLNEEYLQKKTTAEILALGEKLDIFSDKKAGDFLYEVLGGKRGKFDKCKKGELIRIILESGVDLAGKVPAEILK